MSHHIDIHVDAPTTAEWQVVGFEFVPRVTCRAVTSEINSFTLMKQDLIIWIKDGNTERNMSITTMTLDEYRRVFNNLVKWHVEKRDKIYASLPVVLEIDVVGLENYTYTYLFEAKECSEEVCSLLPLVVETSWVVSDDSKGSLMNYSDQRRPITEVVFTDGYNDRVPRWYQTYQLKDLSLLCRRASWLSRFLPVSLVNYLQAEGQAYELAEKMGKAKTYRARAALLQDLAYLAILTPGMYTEISAYSFLQGIYPPELAEIISDYLVDLQPLSDVFW